MQSGFKGANPLVNLVYFVSIIGFCLALSYPYIVALNLIFALIYDIFLSGKKPLSDFLKIVLPIIILFTGFNFLFSHHGVTVLGFLPDGNSLTLESLIYGFVLSLKFASMLIWLDCFGKVLTNEKIIYLFGRFSARIALVISMAVRFIPMFRQQLTEITLSQKALGKDYSDGNIFLRIRNAGHILSILITWIFENAIETSNSMNARGYNLKGKTKFKEYRFTARDLILLLLMFFADVILIVIAVLGKFEAVFTPVIEFSSFTFLTAFGILTTAMLCAIPIITDIRDKRIWKK